MSEQNRQMALLFATSDAARKLRSTLELGVVVALIMLLATFAVGEYETYVIRSQLSEAFYLTSTVKAEMIVSRAETGRWPDTESDLHEYTLSEQTGLGRIVERIDLHPGGSLSVVFGSNASSSLKGSRLTFRPVIVPSHPGAPVFWACSGFGAPGSSATGGDETEVEALYLPSACKEH